MHHGLTLSPGGPGGPSFPDVPCKAQQQSSSVHLSKTFKDLSDDQILLKVIICLTTVNYNSFESFLYVLTIHHWIIYLGAWLSCWASSSSSPTRTLKERERKKATFYHETTKVDTTKYISRLRSFYVTWKWCIDCYIPLDPFVLLDQLCLQHPIRECNNY